MSEAKRKAKEDRKEAKAKSRKRMEETLIKGLQTQLDEKNKLYACSVACSARSLRGFVAGLPRCKPTR